MWGEPCSGPAGGKRLSYLKLRWSSEVLAYSQRLKHPTDTDLHPPLLCPKQCRWESWCWTPGRSYKRTLREWTLSSHLLQLTTVPFQVTAIVFFSSFILSLFSLFFHAKNNRKWWVKRRRRKKKKDHDTLSHFKGPAEEKEKMGDKSIMQSWLLQRTEDSSFGTEDVCDLNPCGYVF